MRKFLLLLLSFSAFLASAQDTLVNYTFTGIGAGGAHVKLDSVRLIIHPDPLLDLDSCEYLTVAPDTSFNVLYGSEGSGVEDRLATTGKLKLAGNPFDGECRFSYRHEVAGLLQVELLDMNGGLLTSYAEVLPGGSYQFAVGVASSQVALLRVKSSEGVFAEKLVNSGSASGNYIRKENLLPLEKQEVALRSAEVIPTYHCPLSYEQQGYINYIGYTTYKGKVYKGTAIMTLRNKRVITFLFDEELEEEGLLPGVFNLSADGSKKIRFSKGNLQYHAVKDEWRFAENQWDFVGEEGNMSAAPDYDGWIDLFAWGTSGYDGKYPYANDICTECGVNFGNSGRDITNTNYDWGVYNAISNGGGKPGIWHTMTDSEWYYLERYRDNADSLRGLATVAGKPGMVLLPEYWDLKAYPVNPDFSEYTDNVYTEEEWKVMEELGAVFFVGAGVVGEWDLGDRVDDDAYTGDFGCYTTSTSMAQNCNYVFSFRDDMYWNGMLISPGEWFVVFGINRSIRTSVRMVQYIINE